MYSPQNISLLSLLSVSICITLSVKGCGFTWFYLNNTISKCFFFFLFPKNKQTHLKSLLGPDFLHLLLSIALTVKCASLPVASAHKNIPAIRISPGCGIEQNRGKSDKKQKNKFKMGFSCRLCSKTGRKRVRGCTEAGARCLCV